ncbi:dephospho-CoA kinase [Jeotgalibacillus marinus]|uniref:Dephospho-CoA kinase n=1 Tax=Jeotgalibacillus marinus TaxID=86667 RepID=A0ABV3Q112_9BACL
MIIGLTGGIASGKSTIANWFIKNDYTVIDADKSARKVVEPGEEAYFKIVDQFGKDVIAEDGTIDRAKLGALIFGDETERKKLNAIIHPAVRQDMLTQKDEAIANGKQTIILDIPLLFESKLQWMVDKIVVVYVEEETQRNRLMKRNDYTEEEANARISSQIPLDEKKDQADAVIDNNGTVDESIHQIKELLETWQLKV